MTKLLSERIKARRIALDISQASLALLAGVTQTQVSRYETGHSEPSTSTLVELARVLKTSTDWLLGLSSDELPMESTVELSELERQAINILRTKPLDRREEIVEILRRIQ